MKKFAFMMIAVSMFTAPAAASTKITKVAATSPAKTSTTSLCPSFEELARTIMKAKQQGHSMSVLMGVAANGDDKTISGIAESIVRMAFDEPNYSTTEYKARQIVDFGNKVARVCYESEAENK